VVVLLLVLGASCLSQTSVSPTGQGTAGSGAGSASGGGPATTTAWTTSYSGSCEIQCPPYYKPPDGDGCGCHESPCAYLELECAACCDAQGGKPECHAECPCANADVGCADYTRSGSLVGCVPCADLTVCAPALTACLDNPDYVALNNCYWRCPWDDEACQEACFVAHPEGFELLQALWGCEWCDTCFSQCGSDPEVVAFCTGGGGAGGAGGAEGTGGSGGMGSGGAAGGGSAGSGGG
jgi:hypothetical protein